MTSTQGFPRCHHCFELVESDGKCPNSGLHVAKLRSPQALCLCTILNGNYQLGKVLGKLGGFGITYLAWDRTLEMKVAIKEYLPRELAGRDQNHVTVIPHSEFDGEDYQKGLEKFLQEARTLASIDHPNIVRVRAFFRENNSAYLVMDYYEGTTLEEYLQSRAGTLNERRTVEMLTPVLDGLREVHSNGILHRDIKPSNIYLTTSGRIILLDFGAARHAVRDRSRSMTIVHTPGYSPVEQTLGNGEQGPWTDIYGCAATMYFCLTGETPQRAEERLVNDTLTELRNVSAATSDAVMRALAIKPEDRFKSVEDFQRALTGEKITVLSRRRFASRSNLLLPLWKVGRIVGIVAVVLIGYLSLKEYFADTTSKSIVSSNHINPFLEAEKERVRQLKKFAADLKRNDPDFAGGWTVEQIIENISQVLNRPSQQRQATYEKMSQDAPYLYGTTPEEVREKLKKLWNPVDPDRLNPDEFLLFLKSWNIDPTGLTSESTQNKWIAWSLEFQNEYKKRRRDLIARQEELARKLLWLRNDAYYGWTTTEIMNNIHDILSRPQEKKIAVLTMWRDLNIFPGMDLLEIENELKETLGLPVPLDRSDPWGIIK